MIRVMRLWNNGDITSTGVYSSLVWAMRWLELEASRGRGTWGKRLWVEDEKKPATVKGHS